MRPPLWRDLRHATLLDAELITQQGTFFAKPVVLSRESQPRMDAIGRPGTRVHDCRVGECDCMEYRRLNSILPALGKVSPRWRGLASIVTSENAFCQNLISQDTITAVNSEM